MVKYVRDITGRFQQRPHYEPNDLDIECEGIIKSFLKALHGEIKYPVQTEDLKKLIERDRRNPTSDHLIQQFAKVLKVDANYLHYLAGKVPDDIRRMNLSAEEVKTAFTAFRKRK